MSHLNLHKAIVLSMAANLIDQLVALLDSDGTEIEPLEIRIEGVKTGEITTAELTEVIRAISAEFKPLTVKTTVEDNRDEGGASC